MVIFYFALVKIALFFLHAYILFVHNIPLKQRKWLEIAPEWIGQRKGRLTTTWRHHGRPSSRSEMCSSGRSMGKSCSLLTCYQPSSLNSAIVGVRNILLSQEYSAEDNL